jgi:hypothetical protein
MAADPREVPPIPVALEHLLLLAAAHEAFAEALIDQPAETAAASGIPLTPTEQRMLEAMKPGALRTLIARMTLPEPERRSFLAHAASIVAAMAIGGAALAACEKPASRDARPTPDAAPPARPAPDAVPPPRATPDAAAPQVDAAPAPDASAVVPRPRPDPMNLVKPAGHRRRPRPAPYPVTDGIRPDRHLPKAGVSHFD